MESPKYKIAFYGGLYGVKSGVNEEEWQLEVRDYKKDEAEKVEREPEKFTIKPTNEFNKKFYQYISNDKFKSDVQKNILKKSDEIIDIQLRLKFDDWAVFVVTYVEKTLRKPKKGVFRKTYSCVALFNCNVIVTEDVKVRKIKKLEFEIKFDKSANPIEFIPRSDLSHSEPAYLKEYESIEDVYE